MKTVKAVIIAIVLLVMPALAFSENFGYMRISLIEGDVQLMTPEAGEWGLASINAPLAEGDQIWTPQGGRVELQLNTGTYIRLDENTALQILSFDKDSSQFYLSQGYAYIFYNAPRRSVIQIDTPDASTRTFDRAIFRVDMSDQYTDVSVYRGYVETENQVGRTRINAGQMLSLGQYTNGEVAPMGPSDEWEAWNKTRNDRVFARRGGGFRYLPAELRAYSYDLDSSGRWVRVPDYGYVWVPTVAVGANWSPYSEGRWIWRGDDYVWVAYEPWGWVPYHYGRWSFAVGIGWFWVPPVAGEVYWGPGYVGWVRTEDYVAWVPLAPGEIYYGRGNYGRYSVNTTNVNINQVNITNVYKNVYVNNGVTVVNRSTFNTGSPIIANVGKNVIQEKIFVKNNISAGAPDIKPTKANYFASTKAVPAAKLPPQAVRNIQTKQLKQSRPFIKEPAKSVFNPGAKPRELPVNTVATPGIPGKGKPMIQQVQPAEKGRTITPRGGPAGRGERQQAQPTEKERTITPQGGPTGRGERQQVQPTEKEKTITPQGGPTGRGERQQAQPTEKEKTITPQGGPTGRGERQQTQPTEKETTITPQGGPTGRGERQQAQPTEKEKTITPQGGPTGRGERQQAQPTEKETTITPQGGPTGRGERQQVQPTEKEKTITPQGGPTGRGERQQAQPAEKGKASGPENGRAAKEEKKQLKPEKKGGPAKPECGPGQKDEKDPDKCPPKDKKKTGD